MVYYQTFFIPPHQHNAKIPHLTEIIATGKKVSRLFFSVISFLALALALVLVLVLEEM